MNRMMSRLQWKMSLMILLIIKIQSKSSTFCRQIKKKTKTICNQILQINLTIVIILLLTI